MRYLNKIHFIIRRTSKTYQQDVRIICLPYCTDTDTSI